jgi:hypothetical protein
MEMSGAVLAGLFALGTATIALLGVVYTAYTQKQPTIIRVGQEVAEDAIATLRRERDEARAENTVRNKIIASQLATIDDLTADLATAKATIVSLQAEVDRLARRGGDGGGDDDV